MFRAAISLLLIGLLVYGCVTDIVPATGERRYLGYTWQQETEIGKTGRYVISQTAMVFGQMNEPPGARLRVALSALTMAEWFRSTSSASSWLFLLATARRIPR